MPYSCWVVRFASFVILITTEKKRKYLVVCVKNKGRVCLVKYYNYYHHRSILLEYRNLFRQESHVNYHCIFFFLLDHQRLFCASKKKLWKFEFSHPFVNDILLKSRNPSKNFRAKYTGFSVLMAGGKTKCHIFTTSFWKCKIINT